MLHKRLLRSRVANINIMHTTCGDPGNHSATACGPGILTKCSNRFRAPLACEKDCDTYMAIKLSLSSVRINMADCVMCQRFRGRLARPIQHLSPGLGPCPGPISPKARLGT